MKPFFLCVFFVGMLAACKTPNIPSSVGLVPLTNYMVKPGTSLSEDTSHFYFNSETAFLTYFTATKSVPGQAVVPDFSGQRVIAVIMKPTTDIVQPAFEKAEISGSTLNVYYNVISAAGSSFSHSPFVVATVPKRGSVTTVAYFRNGVKVKTISVTVE